MLADQADLTPGELVWVGGDVHLYSNHVEQAREQLSRGPLAWPTMRLTRRPDDIDGYRIEDFEVGGLRAARADPGRGGGLIDVVHASSRRST